MFCCNNKKNICSISILIVMTMGIYAIYKLISNWLCDRNCDCCQELDEFDEYEDSHMYNRDYTEDDEDYIRYEERNNGKKDKNDVELQKKIDEFNSKRINRKNDDSIIL